MAVTKKNMKDLFSGISGTALKHWLSVNGHDIKARTVEQLYQKLADYVNEYDIHKHDTLIDELRRAACSIKESGGKRIFLFENTRSFKSKDEFRRHIGIKLVDEPCLSRGKPSKPKLTYVFWGKDRKGKREIRAQFTEMHHVIRVDKEKRLIEQEEAQKVIVIVHSPHRHLTQIRYDAPGDVHPHKNEKRKSSKSAYINYYLEKAKEILGTSQLTPFALGEAMNSLAQSQSVPRVFRMPHEAVRTGYGMLLRSDAPEPSADVRDDRAHQGAARDDGRNWVYRELRGYFLAKLDCGLSRELYADISSEGHFTVRKDCLDEEIEYAISTLIPS